MCAANWQLLVGATSEKHTFFGNCDTLATAVSFIAELENVAPSQVLLEPLEEGNGMLFPFAYTGKNASYLVHRLKLFMLASDRDAELATVRIKGRSG